MIGLLRKDVEIGNFGINVLAPSERNCTDKSGGKYSVIHQIRTITKSIDWLFFCQQNGQMFCLLNN